MSEQHTRTVPDLNFHDIQGTLLRRRPDVYYGVYLLFRIDDAEAVKRSLRTVLPKGNQSDSRLTCGVSVLASAV